jgi:hypothetical protein
VDDALDDALEHQHGRREQQPEEDRPAALALGRIDLDVERVRAGPAPEGRERVGDQEDVAPDPRRVAQVRGQELVQPLRRAPADQRREPRRDREQRGCDPPDVDPDEVRDREDEPQQDAEAPPLEALVDANADRRRPLARTAAVRQVACAGEPLVSPVLRLGYRGVRTKR